MNWMIYYLCKNPELKTRLISELDAMFPNEQSTETTLPYTQVNTIRLLEHAEIECLRLHPPIGYAMPRDTPPRGAVICNHFIPGGVAVGVPAATIGRNAEVYPDPHSFRPDRWADATAEMKTCFLGFGYGSRQCIGRNVANQFVVKMIATLLVRYEFELEDPELVLGTKEFTILKPDKAYRVILRKRVAKDAAPHGA
jgi:cytochrome P450